MLAFKLKLRAQVTCTACTAYFYRSLLTFWLENQKTPIFPVFVYKYLNLYVKTKKKKICVLFQSAKVDVKRQIAKIIDNVDYCYLHTYVNELKVKNAIKQLKYM